MPRSVLLRRAEGGRTPLDNAEQRGHCCTFLLYSLVVSLIDHCLKSKLSGIKPARKAVVNSLLTCCRSLELCTCRPQVRRLPRRNGIWKRPVGIGDQPRHTHQPVTPGLILGGSTTARRTRPGWASAAAGAVRVGAFWVAIAGQDDLDHGSSPPFVLGRAPAAGQRWRTVLGR
jgi:hypothetical protein